MIFSGYKSVGIPLEFSDLTDFGDIEPSYEIKIGNGGCYTHI